MGLRPRAREAHAWSSAITSFFSPLVIFSVNMIRNTTYVMWTSLSPDIALFLMQDCPKFWQVNLLMRLKKVKQNSLFSFAGACKILRVAVCKDRESAVSDPFGEFLIFCPKLALGRLFPKVTFKSFNDFVYLWCGQSAVFWLTKRCNDEPPPKS